MPRNRLTLLVILISGLASLAPSTFAQPSPLATEFPLGSLEAIDQLPASRLRAQIEQLPAIAREQALRWLRSTHFTEHDLPSLHADRNGGIFYVCEAELIPDEHTAADEPPEVGLAAVPVSPFPASLVFHSRPGAANVLYVNFAGENVTNTEWNTLLGRSEIPAMPFSSDSDYTTYSDSEQVIIKRIWQRMAEDYAPFNIDVTTERPGTFNSRTAVALITRKTDANGDPNPYNSAGGVAYLNVFGTSNYAKYRPAWIYHDNLSNNESYVAEAASHEIGHNLGLSHDGKTDGSDYYGGHGSGDISWGPLMGTGYNRNVSHWCKGEYYLGNNTQDDLATIAGKVSYRTDDHGNTAGTATAILISGGTNIVSTTPENDPANANTANKGVLERTTDLDVFSFVTGSGPVRLAVNPWIMPSGTRGGNVDILLELYNEAGTLLLTSNPATQTTALIQTDLPEGRYYLHVRNTAAGDPFSSTPTGYTVYGSIGQYFISGYVTEVTSVVIPPLAEPWLTDLTQSGQTSHPITVTYSDDLAVDVSSIDSNDIRVTGPNGYDQLARFISVDATTDGTPRTATYAADPPDGDVWSPAHNGTYIVSMRSEQVGDTQGAWVAAGQLGEFNVAVPSAIYFASMDADPGWTLEPQWQYGTPSYSSGGPTSGYTGTKIIGYNLSGNYANNLSVKYTTTPPINTSGSSSLTLRFRRWLGLQSNDSASIQASADGINWLNVWVSSGAISDNSWQEVQYSLPTDVAGGSSLRLRWGISSNPALNSIGWNIDDVELLGDGALDTAPPVPTLSVADLTIGGSPSHSCTVTYTDETAVRLASLDSTDLLVTGPNGYSIAAEFVGADLPSDGSPITGTYSIPAPGDTWDAADNGTYTVTLLESAVEDTLNNATPQNALGSFSVAISTATPGALEVTPTGGLDSSGTVGGPFSPASVLYTLTNSGETSLNWTAGKTQNWSSLSASSGTLAAGASTTVTVSINAYADGLAAGSYSDTVSFDNSTTGNGNTTRAVALTVQAPGQLDVTPTGGLDSSGTVGGPFSPASVLYTLTNSGETSLNWTAGKTQNWSSLSASSGTLAAGASTTVTVSINAYADGLAAGNYSDTVSFANSTTGNGNTTRAVALTVQAPGQLDVTPTGGLNSSGTVGGPFSPASVLYTLTNSGETSLIWTAGKTQNWSSLSASSGTLAAGASTVVTVSINANADSLAAGSYSDTVSFVNATTGNGNTTRAVALTVQAPGQLEVSPAEGLDSIGYVGNEFSPSSITYTLANSGDTTLDWTASKTADWLDLSAEAGSLDPGASTTLTVSLGANADSLSIGIYGDTVTLAAGIAESAYLLPATLEVGAPPEFINFSLTDSGVIQMVVEAIAGTEVAIEFSGDFLEWTTISTNQVAADGTVTFTDAADNDSPKQWYRIRTLP